MTDETRAAMTALLKWVLDELDSGGHKCIPGDCMHVLNSDCAAAILEAFIEDTGEE